jgi:hypothetical protein
VRDPVLFVAARYGVNAADVRYYRQFYPTTREAAEAAARSQQQFGPSIDWEEPHVQILGPSQQLVLGLVFAGFALLLLMVWRWL